MYKVQEWKGQLTRKEKRGTIILSDVSIPPRAGFFIKIGTSKTSKKDIPCLT